VGGGGGWEAVSGLKPLRVFTPLSPRKEATPQGPLTRKDAHERPHHAMVPGPCTAHCPPGTAALKLLRSMRICGYRYRSKPAQALPPAQSTGLPDKGRAASPSQLAWAWRISSYRDSPVPSHPLGKAPCQKVVDTLACPLSLRTPGCAFLALVVTKHSLSHCSC
jgi:hypothetical protein